MYLMVYVYVKNITAMLSYEGHWRSHILTKVVLDGTMVYTLHKNLQ